MGLKEFHSQKDKVGLGLIPNIRLSIFEENTRWVVYIQDISWLPLRISFLSLEVVKMVFVADLGISKFVQIPHLKLILLCAQLFFSRGRI